MHRLVITSLTLALLFGNSLAIYAEKKDAPAEEKKTAPTPKIQLLDINTATEDQLKVLPGIAGEHVKKIIANRPYARKEELKLRGILPDKVYELIKELITVVLKAER